MRAGCRDSNIGAKIFINRSVRLNSLHLPLQQIYPHYMRSSSDMTTNSKKGIFSSFKEKHPKATKAIITTGKVVGIAVVAAATATVAFVFLNKPGLGKDCPRAHLTKDGTPKVGYQSPQRANFQVVKDAVLHKTIMRPYECRTCGKFHVGHKH